MGFGLSFVVAAGVFFLVTFERGCGMPTEKQMSDYAKRHLSAEEALNIQKLFKSALEELTDEQVLRVLRRSLLLYFKVCLFPYPPPELGELTDSQGVMEDDSSSPAQKKGLRELLIESVDLVNPERTLESLKSSIKFRLLYCYVPLNNTSFPILPPEPPTPPPTPTTQKLASTPTQGISPTNSNATLREAESREMNALSEFEAEDEEIEGTEGTKLEKMLSIISSKLDAKSGSPRAIPSGPRLVSNDARGEVLKSEAKKNDHVAKPALEIRLKEPLTPRKRIASLHRKTPARDGIVNSNPEASLVRKPHLSRKLDLRPDISPGVNLKKTASEKNMVVSRPKLINPSGHVNEHPVVSTSEKVGKPSLQVRKESPKIMEGNSNEGEFTSVIRINYNELAYKQEKPELVGVDMGFVV